MLKEIVKKILLGWLRVLLGGVSAIAIERWGVSSDEWEYLLIAIVAGLMALGGSAYNKVRQFLRERYAIELSPDVSHRTASRILKERTNETIKSALIGKG